MALSPQNMGLYEPLVQHQHRLLEKLGIHPEKTKREGLVVTSSERKYVELSMKALGSHADIELRNNELLFGFEADIVVRKKSTDGKVAIVNIELDGPHHKHNLSKRHFCELRDQYLVTEHGVRIERWELIPTNLLSSEQILAMFRTAAGLP